jgi:PREDICTED: similar to CG9031-PA
MNRINVLPRGFGAFPALEVLDLTYNNLDAKSFPSNFWMMGEIIGHKFNLN